MADHADDDADNGGVFIYMGGNQRVPRDVTHVRVHKSVKIITREAFRNCRNLLSIEMHDGVEIIEEDAFDGCSSLINIKLPGVKVIEKFAFCDCTALTDVEFGGKLETIGQYAFHSTSLRNIKISKVRVIEFGAFHSCKQLTGVELSEELERIEGAALAYCPRLRRIYIPLKDNLFGNDFVFCECKELSAVELVGGVHKTVSSLLLDSWRNEMKDEIDSINQVLPNTPHTYINKTVVTQEWMERVIQRVDHYKSEHYALLKEFTTLLELALWKANIDDNLGDDSSVREGVRMTRGQRKRARKDRCITSGASVVIKNVLPFLKLE